MLSNEMRKRELEDIFFHSDEIPTDLNEEEQEYWNLMTERYNSAYSTILSKIINADKKSGQ